MHDLAIVIFSGIASVLAILPLPVQWRSGNTATVLNGVWFCLSNLITFVNGIVWWDSVDDPSPGWCDISTRILAVSAWAIAGCSLCINLRLANIARTRRITNASSDKKVALGLALGLGVGAPCCMAAWLYIIQVHRYNIYEGYGCSIAESNTIARIFLVFVPLSVTCLASGIIGCVAAYFFLKQRLHFKQLLRSSSSGLNLGQYARLFLLTMLDLVVTFPLVLYNFVSSVQTLVPQTSWADIHYNWSRVGLIPAISSPLHTDSGWMDSGIATMISAAFPQWTMIAGTLVFFLLLGLSEDAIKQYLDAVVWLAHVCRTFRPSVKRHSPVVNVESSRQTTMNGSYLGSTITDIEGRQVIVEDDLKPWGKSSMVGGKRPDGRSAVIAIQVETEVV